MSKLSDFPFGFGLGSAVSIELNRRRGGSYNEDFVIEKQMKMI